MKYLTSVLLSIIILSSCQLKKKTEISGNTSTQNITDIKWGLIELNSKSVTDTVSYIRFDATDKRYEAYAGCNRMGGQYELSGTNKIKFDKGMMTMMACPNMETEGQLSKVFLSATTYKVNNGVLTLLNDKAVSLAKFKAIAASEELAGTWKLEFITGPRIAFDGLYPNEKPVITIDAKNHKASGNSSCNFFNVGFTTDANQIKFNEVMSTKKACQGNGETVFLETLKKITSFKVSGNTLTFKMNDIDMMRFKKQ